ncbi:MAG: hypothetical protein AMJ53_17165, partial [Gammaproteobacteria bacterium SG8_11]
MTVSERHKYLHLMGIQPWALRHASSPAVEPVPVNDAIIPVGAEDVVNKSAPAIASKPQPLQPEQNVAAMDWEQLRSTVLSCQRCELHQSRTQAVFGVGNQQAQWLVIGEAPGADEDRQGEPFVGRAGQLLNNMLYAIGLNREQVYIANVLKCRPPNNRDPKPEEVACCEEFLRRQVVLIQPKIILAVGRIAAHNLLKTDISLAKLRQRTFNYGDTQVPLIVTYHPAYLLRSPREKRKAWQ